ncbi:flagellar hook-associated protein FlgK [Ramlibacter sp. H39-3-26]|uniref:flagellar hook-associated protein FlgK n=1 Tax=Curvibacter soli TaxID=3031331 RepID=UPI0023DC493D|nr:flagellar hook-associated protein FlgK [Ramlibacter sp. H39-3-26]MDF1484194.1 flagellar hook-associated protein FlgK [Ramlibacter sp. H39-3-26]
MTINNIALSGALAAQAALATASQNVANVMTPGYTRQGVLLSSVQLLGGTRSPGNGVEVSALLRFSDSYKSQQLWKTNSDQSQYSASQPYLTQLESVMGDDTSNIDGGIDAFFAALNAATMEPTSTPLRQQVINTADALAQRFNSLNQLFGNQLASVYRQREAMVSQVNSLTASIAKLNEKIAGTRGTGVNASGLIDERDNKIDELAGLVGIQVVDQEDGSRNVSLRGGQPLVLGSLAGTLSVDASTSPQSLKLGFVNEQFSLAASGLGGSLGGLGDFEKDQLLPLQKSIQQMAQQITTNINTQLAAGFAMNGSVGAPLFDAAPLSGIMQVSSGILPQDLAFSSNATLLGDSGNLQTLLTVKDQPVTLGLTGAVLLSDAHTQLVGWLAMGSQQNQVSLSTATTVRNQAVESWKSTSGVNADEEAINLMQYQQMYEANMKVIAVSNQLFDSVLAMFG